HRYAQKGVQADNFFVTIRHGDLAPVATPGIAVTVDDVVIAGGLQFVTSGDFSDLSGVHTTSAVTRVGFIPVGGAAFTPMATLAGGTTINTIDQTFSNAGAVTE